MRRIAEFFEGNNGKLSGMRLMAFIALLVASFIGIASLFLNRMPNALLIVSAFLAGAFGGKAYQQKNEKGGEYDGQK